MNKATHENGAERSGFKKKFDDVKWAAIWFDRLCHFTKVPHDNGWCFSADQVIAFLRSRIRSDPAWKRLKIVQGLIFHQRKFPTAGSGDLRSADLRFIEVKLKEMVATEKMARLSVGEAGAADGGKAVRTIDVVGKINPREPIVVQEMRRKLRLMGREWNTEKAYIKWVKRFLISRGVKTLEGCQAVGRSDVEAFLTDLVVDGNVAASTQDQAFYAVQFLFENVLDRDIGDVQALRSAKPKLRPTVMSMGEVDRVLEQLRGRYLLVAQLLYGSGLRVGEALRLRVKDIDFDQRQILVHCGKGDKSRLVPLPERVVASLRELIEDRRRLHEVDLGNGRASVWLPFALDRKFVNAHREFKWQFLFASARHSKDPKSGNLHRHHIHRDSFSKALRNAVERSGILRYVTAHTFRHTFATVLLRTGTDIRVLQELLGHADVSTTMIYTHVLFDDKAKVVSPLDLQPESVGEGEWDWRRSVG